MSDLACGYRKISGDMLGILLTVVEMRTLCVMTAARKKEPIVPVMTFGDRVRLARRQAGISGVNLSEMLGMHKTAAGFWEAEGKEPRALIPISKEIGRITGVDWVWLATGYPQGTQTTPWINERPGHRVEAAA